MDEKVIGDSTEENVSKVLAATDAFMAELNRYERLQEKYAVSRNRDRALLTYMSDMVNCIAFSAAGSYLLHHPTIFWENQWVSLVISVMLLFVAYMGSWSAVATRQRYSWICSLST